MNNTIMPISMLLFFLGFMIIFLTEYILIYKGEVTLERKMLKNRVFLMSLCVGGVFLIIPYIVYHKVFSQLIIFMVTALLFGKITSRFVIPNSFGSGVMKRKSARNVALKLEKMLYDHEELKDSVKNSLNNSVKEILSAQVKAYDKKDFSYVEKYYKGSEEDVSTIKNHFKHAQVKFDKINDVQCYVIAKNLKKQTYFVYFQSLIDMTRKTNGRNIGQKNREMDGIWEIKPGKKNAVLVKGYSAKNRSLKAQTSYLESFTKF